MTIDESNGKIIDLNKQIASMIKKAKGKYKLDDASRAMLKHLREKDKLTPVEESVRSVLAAMEIYAGEGN